MKLSAEPTDQAGDNPLSLTEIDRDLWQHLRAAPTQKDYPFKTCTLSTVAPNGWPDARTVVLRQTDETARTLWFHTDVRASKVAHLQAKPEAVLLFWDTIRQIQLRCRTTTKIHTNDAVADEQWAKTWEGNRKMYLSEHEPGSVQPGPYPGFPVLLGDKLPTRAESEAGRPNFAAVACTVLTIDYLHLSRAGQTRALFKYEGEDIKREWLAP